MDIAGLSVTLRIDEDQYKTINSKLDTLVMRDGEEMRRLIHRAYRIAAHMTAVAKSLEGLSKETTT